MIKITLWDENAPRLQNIQANLSRALQALSMKAEIECQSEPPLLNRMGLAGTTPVVEIDEHCWRYKIGAEITTEQFIELLTKKISHNACDSNKG